MNFDEWSDHTFVLVYRRREGRPRVKGIYPGVPASIASTEMKSPGLVSVASFPLSADFF